jgi:hypothetical protein
MASDENGRLSDDTEQKIEREVVETFRANQRIHADALEVTHDGETRKYYDIYRLRTEQFSAIGSDEIVERDMREDICRIPAGRSYDVLTALAEALGCEVTPQ